MREIVVRNLTSSNRLNRDWLVTENMQQGEYTTRVVRRCTYRVESETILPSNDDCIRWARNVDPQAPRQVFVTKELDPETGAESVVYKVLGHIYVVWDRSIFCVKYRHILSMDIGTDPALPETEF